MPRIGLLAAAIAGGGCHAHPENCQLQCEETGSPCSDGLICSAEGYCVQQDWSGTCTSRARGSAGSVGGSITSNYAESTSVATGGSSASVWTTSAGVAEPSSTGGSAASVEQTGGTASVVIGGGPGALTSSGGMGNSGGMGGIAGTTASAGACSSGQPSILEKVLPTACLGEIYGVQLTAESASNDLEWTAVIPEEWGLSLSTTGLLNGITKRAGVLWLDIAVRDRATQCTTSSRMELTIDGETNTACPTIQVVVPRSTTADTLSSPPPACRGWPYSASFAATGGLGTYAWQIVDPPAGFDFNPQTQTLSSTGATLPSAAVKVTLQLTDSAAVPNSDSGRRVQRSFTIPIREKCWLGYLSTHAELGVGSLQLSDPLLETRLRRPLSDSPEVSVLDFKFSPNGKFVAYRLRNVDGSISLWLWQAPKWDRELELALEGSVTHYEWSNDSTVLAAVMTTTTTTGTSTWLGGVKVDSVPDSSPAGSIQGVSVPLQPLAVRIDEHSQLLWYGDASSKYLAFDVLGKPKYPERQVGESALEPAGFGIRRSLQTGVYESIAMYPSSDGYFIAERNYGYMDYRRNNVDGAIRHGNAAVAPSGNYVAVSDGTTLQLRQPKGLEIAAQTDQCATLLAWAKAQEHLACIGGDGSAVFSHAFDTTSRAFGSPVPVENSGDYAQSDWSGHPRLMSPSGDWLALVTANRLFMASLRTPVPGVLWSDALAEPTAQTSLSFAPNEDFLALQRGNFLLLYHVAALRTGALSIATLATTAATCHENALPAPTWCGSSRGEPLPKWSADSQLLAYVSEVRQLKVQDLRRWSEDSPTTFEIEVATNCDESCARGIRFQP